MTRLSVVIATYNRSSLVVRAVRSALDLGAEVVVVDDAGDDDTPLVVDRTFGKTVQFLRLPVNRGPGPARNAGAALATGELILFLDDDDYALAGADHVIYEVADRFPDFDLYLHNCRYPDGSTSISSRTEPTPYLYPDWLHGKYDVELKPVVRRRLFDYDGFDDLGGSCEMLLWGRTIRAQGAVVSGTPIVVYDTTSSTRLVRAAGLLRRRAETAAIGERWLEDFGEDVRIAEPRRWARRVLSASTYHLLCGNRARARELFALLPAPLPSRMEHLAFTVASRLPTRMVRLLFLAQRRELLLTARNVGLRRLFRL